MLCQWSSWMWRGSTWWRNSFMQWRLEVQSSFTLSLTQEAKILIYYCKLLFVILRISVFLLCVFSAGIDEQGLYRIAGVNSRVQKLLSLAMGEQNRLWMIIMIKTENGTNHGFAFNTLVFLSLRSKDVCWCGVGKPWVGDQDHHKCYQALSQVSLKRE